MALTADLVTNVSLTFARMRQLLAEQGGGIQEGVYADTDLKVAQRAAGANMSVDIAAGAGWVQVDSGTRNGFSHVFNDGVVNQAITAAHATLPRLDIVCLQYNDTAIPAGVGGNVPTIRVIAGTPTAGCTLENRSGAGTLPNDALRLADVLVPAAAASIVTANIRDRRRWARGAFSLVSQDSGGDYTIASTVATEIDATNIRRRIECSGAPVRMTLAGLVLVSAAERIQFEPRMDGVALPSPYVGQRWGFVGGSGEYMPLTVSATVVPPAGSHTFSWYWSRNGATATVTLRRSAGLSVQTTLEEILRVNASND